MRAVRKATNCKEFKLEDILLGCFGLPNEIVRALLDLCLDVSHTTSAAPPHGPCIASGNSQHL